MILRLKLLIWFLLFFVFAVSVNAQEIVEISVEGNKKVDDFYVKEISNLNIGDTLDREKFREAIKLLYARGQFDNVEIDAEEREEGVAIRITVQERPVIRSIEIEGTDRISKVDIWKEIDLSTGQYLDPARLEEDKRDILQLYEEDGYMLADVEVETQEFEDVGEVALNFNIHEGEKVKIEKIRFQGNKSFSDKKLRKQMEDTHESHWWNTAHFNQEKFQADLDRVIDFYMEEGYINAEIVDYELQYDDEKKNMFIYITVEEGKEFTVGRIEFEGNDVFTTLELADQLKFEEKSVYNQKKINETLENLYSMYAEDGYIFCNIYPDLEIEETTVNLTYRINEGEQAIVNEIIIQGNTKTYEKVIRRQISIFPGDVFRRSKIMRSQRDIMHLGYFDETAFNFDIQPAGTGDENEIDLIFDLAEKRTGNISLGAGYSSQDKLTGFLELSENNLFGRGQRVNVRWQFGKTRQDYEIGFTEPWLFNTPTLAGADIFHTTRDMGYYDKQNSGLSLRIGRPIPWLDYSRAYLSYTLEDIDIDLDSGYEPTSTYLQNWDGPQRTSSLRLNFSRDSSNDLYCPDAGSETSLSLEYAGGDLLRGDIKYQKYIAESTWYFPGFWKFALSMGVRAGYVNGLNSPNEVPIYERFELGGMIYNRLRGYDDYSVIPEGNSYREGGRSMVILTSEYKFPVVENQVFLLGFVEAGNTWNSLGETDLSDLKRSAGFGIRVITPLGPLGFDYAYGFDRGAEGKWEPHFVFGSFF